MDYDNVNELCDDVQFELKHIHDLSDYIVDGQHCGLKLTENAERHTFNAPCCCFENAPYTELTFV